MSEVEASAPVESIEAKGLEESAQPSVDVTPEQKAQMIKTFKLKVDGEEIEEQIDLADEEGLKRQLQLARAAQKRMQEASRQKAEAESFIQRLKTNPLEVLNDPSLGVNFRQIAEEYLAEQLEQELMSPEEKRIREAERIIREREAEMKAAREREESEQIERLKNHYAQDYDKKITEALQTSGLPKTPKTVKRMAELMKMNLSNGLDLEPKDLVQLVREDYVQEMKSIFGAADGEALFNLLGDDVVTKIRKTDLQKLKAKLPQSRKQSIGSSQKQSEPKRALTRDEWREEIRRRAMD